MVWPVPYVLSNERKEEMNRVLGILLAATLSVSAFASIAFAQQPQHAPDGPVVIRQERIFQGPEGVLPPPGADFVFISSENFGGKIVKGAPYSAEAVTESIQTLADGNRIVNKMTSQVYRDGEGRTRREQTLKGLGGVGTGEEPLQTIFINDPVAGVTYTLDTRTHTAHKSAPFKFQVSSKGGALVEMGRYEYKAGPDSGGTARVIVTTPVHAPPQAGTRV